MSTELEDAIQYGDKEAIRQAFERATKDERLRAQIATIGGNQEIAHFLAELENNVFRDWKEFVSTGDLAGPDEASVEIEVLDLTFTGEKPEVLLRAGDTLLRSTISFSEPPSDGSVGIEALNFDSEEINTFIFYSGIAKVLVSLIFTYRRERCEPPPWNLGNYKAEWIEAALERVAKRRSKQRI